ncbi:HlyD family type I secretion periplasmic adaptor subunit [Pseudorhodobacter sp.]|uniref:HlyD family type I secretion periplasmic adaptor subunit n=1 Tax=Pseudorhodobacter sp. TaxID=1934400 RepID=UPI00264764DB|nr:HlyD family type I secretion periplasmic adaptor subunit [Pseudorhodobacter sp.]MDN5786529.1 HlyD family type I secretion periplasmic adaptor subunit [Pseudorhodobacter sp.]
MMTTFDHGLEEKTERPGRMIWLIAAVVVIFIVWAAFAWVDEIVRARGQVVSSSRPQIIQNLEGGILAELDVAEGDVVEPGQPLARLYGTQYQTAVDELRDQIGSMEIRRRRLEAEMAGMLEFDAPPDLAQRLPDIVASEGALLAARQTDFIARRDGAKQVMEQAQKELDLLENMYSQEVAPLIEVTKARRAFRDTENRYSDTITQMELERAKEYSDTLEKLTTLRANLKGAADQLNRTVLTAPMKGIVNKLSVTTIGGVIRPGEEIMQIVPMDEEMFIEAKVKPENIASVKMGQEATIKLSAYDYTIYGSLHGEVVLISADTFKDERARNPDEDAHYKVTLRVDLKHLTERQAKIDIRPGMQAEVELQTGGKTILTYLTKPLYKSREALRER